MESSSSSPFVPAEPRSIEETGLRQSYLSNHVLRVMYTRGFLMGHEIAEATKLPFANVIDRALEFLRREHLVEVKGSSGFGESSYQYVISDEGRDRARELMGQSQYAGAAPVPLETYTQAVLTQSLTGQTISEEIVRRALDPLIFPPGIYAQLGPAVNSGKSIFIFGNSGNGKTAIAERIGTMLPGKIFIPYAVNVDGNIIKVFDLLHPRPAIENAGDDSASPLRNGERYDRRWVLIGRPIIALGGELVLSNLELNFDPIVKYYEAPFQMKANGGMLFVDDFGRQQMRPRDLLNRWIVPLEKRFDYLTLATGHKIDVPFDALIVFATNLKPEELVDEAFLRRIRYKIHVPDPTWDSFREIFKHVTDERGVTYSEEALRYLVLEYYINAKRKPRAVHPRDLIDELIDIARYRGIQPTMSKELLDLACQAYFLRG